MSELIKSGALKMLAIDPAAELEGDDSQHMIFRAAKPFLHMKRVLLVLSAVFALTLEVLFSAAILPELDWIPFTLLVTLLIWVATLGSMVFGLITLRIDFELRSYTVTDRSLYIREGIWTRSEMRLSFENIQNVSIHQNPIERLFGISNLVVETAGGGVNPLDENSGMHTGVLRGIDNADEVQQIIRARMERGRTEPVVVVDNELTLLQGISEQFQHMNSLIGGGSGPDLSIQNGEERAP